MISDCLPPKEKEGGGKKKKKEREKQKEETERKKVIAVNPRTEPGGRRVASPVRTAHCCAGLMAHGDFLAATSNCFPSKYGFQFASSAACDNKIKSMKCMIVKKESERRRGKNDLSQPNVGTSVESELHRRWGWWGGGVPNELKTKSN